ncbi:filamentous hemagglutinin (plasmid) [Paenibacillus peoriae]|uniref:Filamentous hemagglutinin n=1 Tax=Paenibacillus peoriae TaxID=59893 RepID=A0A7H0YH53_9BACL|nr:filamentous hemagglutinin [Paenibacillus peoriae]QNR70411.1 filamentous hemagglutinin [Paenibacillus peoriae]
MGSSVIRNYRITQNKRKKQTTFELYPHPVEVLTPAGWQDIESELQDILKKSQTPGYELTEDEKNLHTEYMELLGMYGENKIASSIVLDTLDIDNIEIVGRDRVKHVLDAETREEIPFVREFAYVYGAANTSGIIILPYDNYDQVYTVSDADEDGVGELSYVKSKEETNAVRPYYEKVDGKTYIYVNHFSGGGGTQTDPYIVSTEQDLFNVRNAKNAWYLQTADITMGSYQSGAGWTPIMDFAGRYDGGGFSIKSLYINSTSDNVGLFGSIAGGMVHNLRLVNPNVVSTGTNVGSFVGYGYNVRLLNCNVIGGTVQGNGSVGGIVGLAYGDNRYNTPIGSYVYLSYCYNYKCNVRSSGDMAGGLVGRHVNVAYGTLFMESCYSTGKVEDITIAKDRSLISGDVGTSNTLTMTNCFWDIEKSGRSSGAGTGLSTAEMKKKSSYVNFDFQNYWHIDQNYNEGYPEHRHFIRYANGDGSKANPFLIYTEFDLVQMRWWRHGFNFRFEDDIKMISYQSGNGFNPLGFPLTGKYDNWKSNVDGNGRSISNMFIYRVADIHVSLFGTVEGATIKNLDIIDPNVTGSQYVSPLGTLTTDAKVMNCHSNTFNASSIKGTYTGGLIGSVGANSVTEDSSANVSTSTSNYGGGFVGAVSGAAITRRCYSAGKAENTGGYLGGFFGTIAQSSTCLIEDCFSITEVNGTYVGLFGGYCGGYTNGSMVRRCLAYGKGYASVALVGFLRDRDSSYPPDKWNENYWDKTINPTAAVSLYSVAKTTTEMKAQSVFDSAKGWDWTSVWIISDKYNNGYPVLRKLVPLDLPILGFRNEFGKYYTDNAGEPIRHLEFGTMIASQTSVPRPVWLQNNADFNVNNMRVYVDRSTVAKGMKVELSIAETPFIPLDDLTFSGTYAKGAAAKFYVRLGSDISVKTGGTFDLRAKASPV